MRGLRIETEDSFTLIGLSLKDLENITGGLRELISSRDDRSLKILYNKIVKTLKAVGYRESINGWSYYKSRNEEQQTDETT